jgi:hypothetical protein
MYNRLNLSVAASEREVVRATRRKFHRRVRTCPEYAGERKRIYKAMLREHRDARGLFNYVTRGKLRDVR